MTSPYITPAVRSDAAQIAELLKGGRMTRNEIAKAFNRNKTALDRGFAHAKNLGLIAMVRHDGEVWWLTTEQAYALVAEKRQAERARHALRLMRRYRMDEVDFDAVPDMPVVRRIIPAGSAPMPATNAPRWIFEAA